MDRRNFLGLGAAAGQRRRAADRLPHRRAAALRQPEGGHASVSAREDAGERPNIFLISLDMVSPDHHHPTRTMHREMDLPAMRVALRATASVFHNAFCASPLCAPARATLATGRYTYITANGERAHDGHETILRSTDVIFQEYLKATGYRTKHCRQGPPGHAEVHGRVRRERQRLGPLGASHRDDELYLAHLRRLGVKPQRYRKEIRGLQQDRKTPQASLGGWIEQNDGKPFPMEAQYTHYLVDRAIAKLDAALAEPGPIYLQLDIFDPHQPFSVPAGLEARERELRRSVGLPESYEQVQARDWKPDPSLPEDLQLLPASPGACTTRRRCSITGWPTRSRWKSIDRALGRFFAALKQRNLYDDAVIVFTSDHGEMNGRRALVDKGVYLFPDVLRVPFAIKMPRGRPGAHRGHAGLAPGHRADVARSGRRGTGGAPGRHLADAAPGRTAPPATANCSSSAAGTPASTSPAPPSGGTARGHWLYTYNLSSEVDELYDLTAADAINQAPAQPAGAPRRWCAASGRCWIAIRAGSATGTASAWTTTPDCRSRKVATSRSSAPPEPLPV